jgi:hypothetical protein
MSPSKKAMPWRYALPWWNSYVEGESPYSVPELANSLNDTLKI